MRRVREVAGRRRVYELLAYCALSATIQTAAIPAVLWTCPNFHSEGPEGINREGRSSKGAALGLFGFRVVLLPLAEISLLGLARETADARDTNCAQGEKAKRAGSAIGRGRLLGGLCV